MPASIFAGSKVKTLKSTLSLNGGADIISSTTNPQSSAVSAEPGSLLLNTTSGIMYRKLDAGSTTNWVEVGSGSGGKNYIKNPDFDGGTTTNWAMRKVSLSSLVPTGNIGAADAGHTIAASSSSPLEGANSLLVQGASLFTAGNCLVSDAFAIDRQDQAKVMGWSFYYEAVTANMDFPGTSAGTWAVYIAEVTTATPDTVVSWIQPAGVYNLIQSSGAGIASGTFQTTAAGTAYRLVLVCINSEAAATTLKVDDFQLGPQSTVQGAAISDWVSYTPVFTGMGGAPATTFTLTKANYRRVGDSMQIRISGRFVNNGSGGTAVTFSLPAGSIDLTKIDDGSGTNFGYAGDATFFNLVGAGYAGVQTKHTVYVSSSTVLGFIRSGTSGALTGADILNTTEVDLFATVPISGWSSNTVMSQDTDTRVVAFSARNNSASFVSVGTTATKITTFGNLFGDTHSAWSAVNQEYTVPVSGWYEIDCSVYVQTLSGTGFSLYIIDVTGTPVYLSEGTKETAGTATTFASKYLNAGTKISIFGKTASGTADAGSYNPTYLKINRLSGPATIAASETVAMARVISSVISVPTATYTFLNFQYAGPNPPPLDTHGSYRLGVGYNPATGAWTTTPAYVVPVSGVYSVSSTLLVNGHSGFKQLFLEKNGSQFAATANDFTFSVPFPLTTTGIVSCIAGDLLQVRYYQTSGGAINVPVSTTAAWNTFNVERIG